MTSSPGRSASVCIPIVGQIGCDTPRGSAMRRAHLRKRGTMLVGTTEVSAGMLPRLIVTVKSGSRDWRDRWFKLSRMLGLGWTVAGSSTDGWPEGPKDPEEKYAWDTQLDVWGTPEALERLTSGEFKAVVSWEYAVSAPTIFGLPHPRHRDTFRPGESARLVDALERKRCLDHGH